jgi:hypothetical protein
MEISLHLAEVGVLRTRCIILKQQQLKLSALGGCQRAIARLGDQSQAIFRKLLIH